MPGYEIEYTVHVWQEGEQFVARAMPLDVMSAGATPDSARKAISEAVGLFLNVTSDRGTLDEVLEEAGYQFENGRWTPPPGT